MIALLLRLYPARWRARYGDEFAAVLEPAPVAIVAVIAAIVAFPAGWIALGISALRITGPAPITFEGASL